MEKSKNSYYGIASTELIRANTYMSFAELNDDYNGVASTCSQSCEKFMKAYIEFFCIEEDVDIMRTHNLKKLAKYINSHLRRNELSEIEYNWVGNFYFDSRYPGASYSEANREEAEKCLELTKNLKNWIDRNIEDRKPLTGFKTANSFSLE